MICKPLHRGSYARRARVRGLASLEFALALPILIVLTLLLVNVGVAARTRTDVIVAARVKAMESAYRLWAPPTLLDLRRAPNGEPIFVSTRQRPVAPGANLATTMRQAGGADQLDSNTARTPLPGGLPASPTVAQARAFFFGNRHVGLLGFVISSEFTVIATPIWERSDMPLGYDAYLERDLRLQPALPSALPRTP